MNYPTLVGDSNWYFDDQDYKTDISFSGHVLLGAKERSLTQPDTGITDAFNVSYF
jgi:hypothetical protein